MGVAAQVNLQLTQTDIVDGVPVVSEAALDGACEVLLRLWQDPLALAAQDEDSEYPYRYERIPVTVSVTMANGEQETLELETDDEGVVRFSLPAFLNTLRCRHNP